MNSRETPRGSMALELTLKAEGEKLTGHFSRRGGRARQIQNGRISGDEFEFSTMRPTKQGERKMTWSGKAIGDELKGEMRREGGAGARPFTAKRE